MKKTPWFPSGTKPARKGVYETKGIRGMPNSIRFQRWDGRLWYFVAYTEKEAAGMGNASSLNPQPIWRGRTAP